MARSQSRVLHCRFNADNELTSHAWQVHATLDTDTKQTMPTLLDQPTWECVAPTENVFRILDFTDLFAQLKFEHATVSWLFYKDVVPYTLVRFHPLDSIDRPSLSRPMTFMGVDDEMDNGDYFLIVDLANRNVRFESVTRFSAAGAFAALESCYHAFVTRLEQWFLQSQLTKFMRDQDRASTQLTTQLHNIMFHG